MNREQARQAISRLARPEQNRDLVDLAERLSLALTVDPHLLRLVRTARFPSAGPELEADLWLSPLVQSSGVDGFVFHPAVGEELLNRLGENEWRLAEAKQDLDRAHQWLPGSLATEERIRSILAPGTPESRAEAERVLADIADYTPGSATGAFDGWRTSMVRRLPTGLQSSGPALVLSEAGNAGGGIQGRSASNRADGDGPTVPVWGRFVRGGFQVVRQSGQPSGRGWKQIPATGSRLDIDGDVGRPLQLDLQDGVRRLAPAAGQVQVGDGQQSWLLRRGRRTWWNPERRPRLDAHTLTGHTNAVWSVAYHPNGHQLATTSADNTIKLWDTTTTTNTHTLTGHTAPLRSVAYHPNGHQLATTSTDGTIKLWDPTPPIRLRIHADSPLQGVLSRWPSPPLYGAIAGLNPERLGDTMSDITSAMTQRHMGQPERLRRFVVAGRPIRRDNQADSPQHEPSPIVTVQRGQAVLAQPRWWQLSATPWSQRAARLAVAVDLPLLASDHIDETLIGLRPSPDGLRSARRRRFGRGLRRAMIDASSNAEPLHRLPKLSERVIPVSDYGYGPRTAVTGYSNPILRLARFEEAKLAATQYMKTNAERFPPEIQAWSPPQRTAPEPATAAELRTGDRLAPRPTRRRRRADKADTSRK